MKTIEFTLLFILFFQIGCYGLNLGCEVCMSSIEFTTKVLSSDYFLRAYTMDLWNKCMVTGTKEYCEQSRNSTWNIVYKESIKHINSEYICNTLKFCHDYIYLEESLEEYTKRVISNKPKKIVHKNTTLNSENPLKFLVVSDVHIDLDYEKAFFFIHIGNEYKMCAIDLLSKQFWEG